MALEDPIQLKLLKRVRARGTRHLPGEMNSVEREYAAHLKLLEHAGEVEWWMFEGIKLRLADNCFFTPDFFVMLTDGTLEVHEVKGTWRKDGKEFPHIEDDAAVKLRVASAMFPFRVKLVWKRAGKWTEEER